MATRLGLIAGSLLTALFAAIVCGLCLGKGLFAVAAVNGLLVVANAGLVWLHLKRLCEESR